MRYMSTRPQGRQGPKILQLRIITVARLGWPQDGELDQSELRNLTPDDVSGAQKQARGTKGLDLKQFEHKFASRIKRGGTVAPDVSRPPPVFAPIHTCMTRAQCLRYHETNTCRLYSPNSTPTWTVSSTKLKVRYPQTSDC
jgi:hypothetical protein